MKLSYKAVFVEIPCICGHIKDEQSTNSEAETKQLLVQIKYFNIYNWNFKIFLCLKTFIIWIPEHACKLSFLWKMSAEYQRKSISYLKNGTFLIEWLDRA